MKREDILATSRKENQNGDEKERLIIFKSQIYAVIFVVLIGVIIFLINNSCGQPNYDILALIWCAPCGSFAYQAVENKDKGKAVVAALMFILVIFNLVKYSLMVM